MKSRSIGIAVLLALSSFTALIVASCRGRSNGAGGEMGDLVSPAPLDSSRNTQPLPLDKLLPAPQGRPAWFVDITEQSGIQFRRHNGYTGDYWPCEVTGGGVALFDFDGDQRLDVYLVNGSRLPPDPHDTTYLNALFRAGTAGSFVDVTAPAHAAMPGFGQGCAVGDYDNDGFPDFVVANFGQNVLYRNRGDGTFIPVFFESDGPRWHSSAAFGDIDADGDLDLYLCSYVKFDPVTATPCASPINQKRSYCGPEHYEGTPGILLENLGSSEFRDVSRDAGIQLHKGKALGVVIAHLDERDLPDIFIANDLIANHLFLNRSSPDRLSFVEQALELGCGLNGEGQPEAGMGVACGDVDGNGTLDLICTHFYMEHDTLFRNLGSQGFIDSTAEVGLSATTRASMGWGTTFLDYDKDGSLDWVVTNGHLNNQEEAQVPYRMRSKIFHNNAELGRFADVSDRSGPFFAYAAVGRGLAVGDMDRDGDEDLAITFLHEPFVLLENQTETNNHVLRLLLQGRVSNRDGVNTRVFVDLPQRRLRRDVIGGGSYLSASSYELLIGTAEQQHANVTVVWPSGLIERWPQIECDRAVTLVEGRSPGVGNIARPQSNH